MKPSWGKIRIGVIALFAVAAFAIVGLRPSGRAYSATPSPTLFVTNARHRRRHGISRREQRR